MELRSRLQNLSKEYEQTYGFGLPVDLPDYRNAIFGDWSIKSSPGGITSSYLAEFAVEPSHFVMRNQSEVWMSTGLIEIESHAWHLHNARGNVLIAGLGMGMFAHAAASKREVDKVVIVEKSPDVIALFKAAAQFENWTYKDKIEIILGDALSQATGNAVRTALSGARPDYLYADIWPIYPAPEAPQQTRDMMDIYRPVNVGWWGQEVAYGVWLEQNGQKPSMENLCEFFRDEAIPVPANLNYLAFCCDAIKAQLDLDFESSFQP